MADDSNDAPIGFSEGDFNRVREVVRYVESTFPPSGNGRPRLPPPTPDGIPIYNDTGSTLGKYSLVRPHAIRKVSTKIFIDVKQPDTTLRQNMLVVGDNDVPASSYGLAQRGPQVKVLYDTGTPAIGEGYGPKPSQFTASKNYPCCLICDGIYDSSDKIMWARLVPIDIVLGKTNASHAAGASGTVNVYSGTVGSEAIITSMTVSAYNRFTDIDSGKWVFVTWVNGQPYLSAAEC